MKLKYIVFNTDDGLLVPVIFPEVLQHNSITITDATPVSAGFVRVLGGDSGKVIAVPSGESTSLGLHTAPDDRFLLELVLNSKL